MQRIADFAGKVAVVTGGASGIGAAIARALVARGAEVVIADVEQAALERMAGEIGAVGVLTDVSSAASMQALAVEVSRRHGRADILVSNAGVGSTAPLAEMTRADWDWLLGVNVFGLVNAAAAFLPLLRANPEGGYLAVTASEAGFRISPGMGGYSVSKFAAAAIAETLAAELAEERADIGVTLLCPGPVSTRLGSSQRNRADASEGHLVDLDFEVTDEGRALPWMHPDAVAAILLAAMAKGELYAFTHPAMASPVIERHRRIEAGLARAAAGNCK